MFNLNLFYGLPAKRPIPGPSVAHFINITEGLKLTIAKIFFGEDTASLGDSRFILRIRCKLNRLYGADLHSAYAHSAWCPEARA